MTTAGKVSKKERAELVSLAHKAAEELLHNGDRAEEIDPDIAHMPYAHAARSYPHSITRHAMATCPRFRIFEEAFASYIIDVGRSHDSDAEYETDEPAHVRFGSGT